MITPVRSRTSAAEVARSMLRSWRRSEEHTSELQSQSNLVCRLLLEKKKKPPFMRPQSPTPGTQGAFLPAYRRIAPIPTTRTAHSATLLHRRLCATRDLRPHPSPQCL